MKEGASDYLVKPFRIQWISPRGSSGVPEAEETGGAPPGGGRAFPRPGRRRAVGGCVVHSPHPGRDGYGQGRTWAKYIASFGPRAASNHIALNCAALPETLIESELFGHVRGAFTGARAPRRGLFEERQAARCSWTRSARCRLP